MGKNKRRQIVYRDSFHGVDVNCDSLEECDVIDWCSEAAQLGVLEDFQYQPPSIQLSESINIVGHDKKKKVLLREHVYSPDFMIEFDPRSYETLCKEFKLTLQQSQMPSFQVYLDVKGQFQKADGGRAFSLNQKWVYQKTGIYIAKLVPKDFFKRCGCPQCCFFTRKKHQLRKAYEGLKPIPEMLHLKTNNATS